ncbi:MAG TPA: AsnC family transcriptional regulator [Bacillota bacterium]
MINLDDLDDLDRRLLTEVQEGLPLTREPFGDLSRKLGRPAPEILERLRRLKDGGLVRRFGGVFDTRALGFASVLMAASVPPRNLERVAAVVNECPGVTHNYAREGEAYNLWFTLSAPTPSDLDAAVADLSGRTGIDRWLRLPAEKVYKIGVKLDLTASEGVRGRLFQAKEAFGAGAEAGSGEKTQGIRGPCGLDRRIIAALQGDIPLVPRPFDAIAESLGLDPEVIIERLRRFGGRGWLRRVAATLYHRRAGFVANAMAVWQVDPAAADQAGRVLAAFPQVSHCYLRPPGRSWPYNLYAMIHGRTAEECRRAAAEMTAAIVPLDHRLLFSTREFKKTSPVYYAEAREHQKEGGET